jgi:bacterioferritin (cytochrome b1)
MNKGVRGLEIRVVAVGMYTYHSPMCPRWGKREQIEIRITREKLANLVHASSEKKMFQKVES